jgi:hypothetical protein
MPLALAGSLMAVQFHGPGELPLTLNKNERFANVSMLLLNSVFEVLAEGADDCQRPMRGAQNGVHRGK